MSDPPRPAPPTRVNASSLPSFGVGPYSSFVGRVEALANLAQALSDHRVVTIIGPPGAGKSRLASEYLARVDRVEEDGPTWAFCDLTEAHDEGSLLAALGGALGVPLLEGVGPSASEQLAVALASSGNALVVIDNAEQVAPILSRLLDRWARAAQNVRFVITSRHRLGAFDEALLDLGPLRLPEAVEDVATSEAVLLFVARVRAVRSGYTISTPEEAESVLELVTQLDGLPLAIELAAARARVLPTAEIVKSLPRRFELLRQEGTARTVALGEEIERSYMLLEPDERAALAQASVFRGGFTLDAAQEVLELPPGGRWALDVLQSLCDKSLLTASDARGTRRFGMLLSIRDFAAKELSRLGELEATARRHTTHFLRAGLEAASKLGERDGYRARRALAREKDNLVAVLERAMEHTHDDPAKASDAVSAAIVIAAALYGQGPLGFSHGLLVRTMAVAGHARIDPFLHAWALSLRVELEVNLERSAASLVEAEATLVRAREASDPDTRALGRSLASVGEILTAQGRFVDGYVLLCAARDIEKAAGRRALEARALHVMGVNRVEAGRLAEGRVLFREALRLLVDGDRVQEARSRNTLGVLELEEGRLEEAEGYLRESLAIATEVGDKRTEALATGNLAALLQEQGRLQEAFHGYERAAELNRRIGSRRNEGVQLAFLGNCHLERGDYERARVRYEDSLAILAGDGWRRAMVLGPYASALAALGEIDLAQRTFEEARRELEEIRQERLLAALSVYEGFLDVGRAHLARARGDAGVATATLVSARHRIQASMVDALPRAEASGGPVLAVQSTDVRIAVRALQHALSSEPVAPAAALSTAFEVAQDGSWFRPPNGRRVDLGRRKALRLLLARFVDERLASPGRVLSTPELVSAGWPGERVVAEAGADRVYTSLSTLRRLGLRDVIQSRDEGYRIDPQLPVIRR